MKLVDGRNRAGSGAARDTGAETPGPEAATYITGMIALGGLLSALVLWRMPGLNLGTALLWATVALGGELLVFSTLTQRAQVNMATTIHMAMLLLLAPAEMVVTLWLSRVGAKFLFQRQVWYRALFNVTQVVVALISAWGVYSALGGRPWQGTVPAHIPTSLLAFVAAGATYHVVNTFGVSRIVGLTARLPLWRTWRDNYGHSMELLNTWALIGLAPVMALCVVHLGIPGLLIFVAPVVLLRQVSAEYVALQNAQRSLVAAERVAAKNEISALVGHRINTALTTLSGQIQLIIMRRERLDEGELETRFNAIRGSIASIQTISQGLIESCQHSRRLDWTRVDTLVDTLLAAVGRREPLSRVRFVTSCDPAIGEIHANRAQLQDVLRNLLMNAAEAMDAAGTPDPTIEVRAEYHPHGDELELLVLDNGPGIPTALRDSIFEPGFSTRPGAGGFGLATARRIITNHHGRLTLDCPEDGGTLFRIVLPASRRKLAA